VALVCALPRFPRLRYIRAGAARVLLGRAFVDSAGVAAQSHFVRRPARFARLSVPLAANPGSSNPSKGFDRTSNQLLPDSDVLILEGVATMQRHGKNVEQMASIAETVWNIDPQSIEAVTTTYRAWLSQANKVQEETMRFAQERFTKELEAALKLARCTNPIEALAVQAEFAQKMAEDYLAEGQKLVEITTEMTKQISASPKPHAVHH
jgi:hypothetical protein